jgi:broad specificity phosphatase PhoE
LTDVLHPEETITSFLLIRHGHTKATEEGRLYTDPNAPLTDKGRLQAQALAAWSVSQKPDALLSSPSLRVRTTADIIGASLEQQPVIIDGLNEWHVGDWEGRTYLDLKNSEPELYSRWSADPIHNAPPGGESISDLCERIERSVKEMISRFEGKKLALVTHAGVIRSAIMGALGVPVVNFWRLSIPVGTVSRLDFSANFATLHFMSWRPDLPKG